MRLNGFGLRIGNQYLILFVLCRESHCKILNFPLEDDSQLFPGLVGVAVSRRSGGRLATMLVDRYFHHSFLFSPSQPFLIERLLGSKTYLAIVDGSAQKN